MGAADPRTRSPYGRRGQPPRKRRQEFHVALIPYLDGCERHRRGPAPAVLGYATVGSAGAASSAPLAGVGLLHLGGALSNATNQSSYSDLIVSQSDTAAAARQPGRTLSYFSGTDVTTSWSTGVPYTQASANGWLLKNAAGAFVKNTGYNCYIGDVGNPAYQAAWATNVIAFLRANGGEGVFIDDVLRDIKPLTGEYPAAYPNQAAWQAAMASFIASVGASLKAAGYYVLVNADGYTSGNSGSDDGP